MTRKPRAYDLACGLGGWTVGLLAEGYDVVGFDIERHAYGDHRYPAQLVLQDIRTLHGSQLKDAALIVASPPCQTYSYMSMPWTRAKQIAQALTVLKFCGDDSNHPPFPDGYTGPRSIATLNELFDACFRIQREAIAAAGHFIPLVVENVRGAQPWVGRARWMYGSFALWGDVPALMPIVRKAVKVSTMGKGWRPPDHSDHVRGLGFNTHAERATKNSGGLTTGEIVDGYKGVAGKSWIRDRTKDPRPSHGNSQSRKAASARIAKIPIELARHIARSYFPKEN